MKKLTTFLLTFVFAALAHAAPPIKIEVTANDQMRFSTKKIEGKVGVPMEITIKHIGKIPKASMSHNMVILKPGAMPPMISMKCAQAKDNNYIATDAESKAAIVAYSPQLGPGESHVIKFTPKEAGNYKYFCSFPGHFSEMQGVIVVK
jgi:azurin